mmetsp:Transcript_28319/g.82025  ORF Transcript_28319/g.82025 Transcript_28319/m.82025 type:complete len:241 (+) Transcript_28319:5713-6435(+)
MLPCPQRPLRGLRQRRCLARTTGRLRQFRHLPAPDDILISDHALLDATVAELGQRCDLTSNTFRIIEGLRAEIPHDAAGLRPASDLLKQITCTEVPPVGIGRVHHRRPLLLADVPVLVVVHHMENQRAEVGGANIIDGAAKLSNHLLEFSITAMADGLLVIHKSLEGLFVDAFGSVPLVQVAQGIPLFNPILVRALESACTCEAVYALGVEDLGRRRVKACEQFLNDGRPPKRGANAHCW